MKVIVCKSCDFISGTFCNNFKVNEPWKVVNDCDCWNNYYLIVKSIINDIGIDLFMEIVYNVLSEDNRLRVLGKNYLECLKHGQ